LFPTLKITDHVEVANILKEHHLFSELLKEQLCRAQNRIKIYADKNRSDHSFRVGEQVLLKLQPYAQHSVLYRPFPKLANKFFGPYEVVENIGASTYKLLLPDGCQVHPVFHVS
jgi:hypothetical protein